MARQTKIYQVKFETDGFKAVARSFQSINGQIDQTLKHHKEAQKIGLQQARDDRGRFVRSRLGLNFQRDDRFIQRKNGDNEFRSRSKGRFSVDHQEFGAGRSQLEASAKIQGEIIGQHVAQAIRASLRGETQAEIDSNSIQSAIKSGFEFALSSTFSGAFQRIGEETIADPVLNAMRQAFAENRKIENAQKNVNPGVNAGSGVGFAAQSIAFGGFQQIGSKFSEIITEDFVRGLSRGFKNKSKKNYNIESVGESVGGFVADPLSTAKDTIRARKIAKLDDSLAEAERLAKQESVSVSPGKRKIFTVGGLGGSGASKYTEELERIGINTQNTDIENLDNPHTGTNIPLSDPLRFASDAILNKYVTNEIIKSQNQDAINMAAKVIAAKRENPNATIDLLGHSAGADIVQQAIAILEKGGYADNVRGIGVGGIDIGTGFDVKNFTNIAGDQDYVVKATAPIGSRPTAKDYGKVSQLGDHKLRTYFAHPDFIKALDQDLQPTAVAKILDNFYEDMIQEYGDDALPVLEEALRDGLKFAGEFDRSFGTEETDRINQVLAKYHQRLGMSSQGINPRVDPTSIVDRQFQRVEEIRSTFASAFTGNAQPQPPRNIPIELAPDTPRPQQIPIEIPEQGFPDTTSIVDRQFQRVEELRQLARAFQPQQPGQTGLWQSNRPIPPGMVPDLTPASIRSLIADAQAQFQQMRPSQLAANQEPQIRPTRSEELPQLIQAYQRSILEAFERSQEEMLRSLRDTITNLSQAPVELDQEGFADTIRSSLSEQARKLIRVYDQAIGAIVGVSADPSTINQGNFSTELEQLREDTAAIMLRFREGIAQNFQETAALLQSLAQSYESESPAQLAGGGRQPYTENFNEIIQDQLTEYQRNIRKLFAEVAQSTAADFTDLRRLRAQLGLPAQAPKAGLSTRYNDRLQNLISGARTSAQERVRGLIPGFQELSPKQRSAELKKMRSQLTQGLAEFRSTMATGDQNAARQLGEGLLQRIEAIRAAYEDLGKNFTGDKRGLGAQKGQLTKQSKEIQARLKTIADNATGSLAAAIEADLGEVGSAGQSIGDALIEGTEDSLDISSPSKVFQQIGENIIEGLKQGLGGSSPFEELKKTIEEDIEYLQSLVAGNTAKSSKILGNAAKKSGFNIGPVYHGSNASFTKFDMARARGALGKGLYFSNSKDFARRYGSLLMQSYLKIQNPQINDESGALLSVPENPDGRIVHGGFPGLRKGQSIYKINQPNQVKSANRFTRTDSGLIVPVSQRFNGGDDIRGNVDISSVRDYVKSLLPSIADNLVDSLTSAIEAQFTELQDSGRSIGDALIEGAEDSLEIQSPSKVFQRIGENIARGLGIGLRENLEEVKQDLTDNLSELGEESAFQATRVVNKFNDMGGIPGLDEKAAQGIEMVRDRLSGLVQEFPAIQQLLQLGTEFGGSIALLMLSFNAIGSILKATGIGQFFNAIATLPETAGEAGRELQSLGIAFESVTGSSALAADAMEYVSDTAEKFGINIRAAEEAYLGLVATTRGTELEGFQTQKIFEAFAQTAALRGLDQQQQQQMFVAVQQVLGKGKLSAEEVRGQLGEIPALAFQQTLASSLGVNLQQLDKLLSTGQLQSDALFKVAQAYESANAQMAGASETATAALARFDNAIVQLQRSVGAEFLAVQTQGAKAFTSALNGITNAIPAIVGTIKSGLIVVLGSFVIQVFSSATAVKLLRMALVALGNLLQRLAPLLFRLAVGIAAVNTAIEVWSGLLDQLKMDETEQAIRGLSLRYQELAGSIDSASEAQKKIENTGFLPWITNVKERSLDIADWGRGALFKALSDINNPLAANFASSAREEFAYNRLNRARGVTAEQISNTVVAGAEQKQALQAAEKMLQLQQQMATVRTIAAGLSAADAEGLAQATETLKELRSEYDGYLKQVGNAKSLAEANIKATQEYVDYLKKLRQDPNLGDYARQQIDQDVERLLEQIELLQSGQKELDAVTSRFEVTLADFTTALKRGIERLANFRERLTNQINEERARLLETGLGLGKGEQTIRLELDRQDFRELEEWVRTLRIESQKITDRLRDPILADQERNLREQADREGVDFGTAFLQRIVEENTQNTEAAQQLLELQNLQNQITEGEVQLQQQALQARQSVRDMTRSVTDFLRQLEQELAEITLQLQEQIQALQQQFRRSQLQKAIVAGSTGMFGSITSSVQGFLDAAGEIAQKYLGQERRKLEFEQKKYDLTTRLRDFSEGLAGATEALATFKNGLTGASGASSPGTARPSSMGETFLGITGDTGIGSGAHLDIRKRGGDRRLTAAEINRFLVDGKPLSSYPITSEFGPRNTGIPGASTDHRGVDFGIDIGKKITTTVPVRRVSMREPSQTGGGGYVVDVLFEDGLEVSLLHQSPEIKTAGIGTSSRSPITGASSVSGATAELLARIRSGEGDYTSINRGRAGDTPGGMPGLANMTIAQVMALQARGEAFAVGAYQFIPDTLQGAVTRSGIDRNRKFDKAAQDQLALELILGGTKRPHLTAYLTGKSNDLNAALSDISHEWAAVTGASGRGAYDGDSAGNMASISVADLLPQVRAQVQGQGAQSVPSEVARSQQLGNEILATQRSQMAASEGEISVAVLDLVQQRKNVLEEVRRLLETSTRDLGVSVTGMSNQMQQYTNPDALLGIQTQVRQQFDDFNLQLYTESQRVGDSIAELQGIIATYPPVIEQLRATNDPVDAEQASLLQGTVDMAKTYLTALEAIDKRLDETQKRSQEAYQKEREYLIQKNQLETENTELALELEIAQTNRNSSLETELAIQQERNNLALQLLEIERQFANRPDELARQQELLRLQSEQRIQTLQFEEQRRALEERSFQTELQTRLNEAQAAQAEGQFGDNGIFGFRATALREENALLQEQIRYEQEVLALRERYRDQPDVLGRMLDQAAQLNQVNLQNIDTQFKDLGETIAEVAEDALGQFFEDIFSGTKSAGEAFRNLAQSILRYFAQMAARNLARGIFSKLGGAFGGFLGGGGGAAFTSPAGWSGFAYGGTVPNYAEGDRVVPDTIAEVMRSLVPGVDAGFRREGSKAALGIFTPGEEILSLKTGEAQRYQLLKRSLGKNPLQAIMSGSFAYGGTVGINPDILTGDLGIRSPLVPVSSVLQMQSQRSSTGGGNVTINYEVKTPDANSFRRSQYQIDKDATIAAKQVLNRK